jgi:hypothetical protein
VLLIVADDIYCTEREVAGGELLACPDCGGELRPRQVCPPSLVAYRHGRRQLRPRRGWFRGHGRAHVLVPGVMFPRRADAVEVVAQALVASGAGGRPGDRGPARTPGRDCARLVPPVRGPCEQTRQHATRWLLFGSTSGWCASTLAVTPRRSSKRWGCCWRPPPQLSAGSVGVPGRGARSSWRCARDGCWSTRAALPGAMVS